MKNLRPMKPETLARRRKQRAINRADARRERIARLAETVAKHERAGNLKTAAHYAEMFVEEHDRAEPA